jgi:hypothetical protein
MLKKKQEITDWLEIHRAEITSGKLVVFLQHEYHLLSGGWCGYVWGKTKERIVLSPSQWAEKTNLLWGSQSILDLRFETGAW